MGVLCALGIFAVHRKSATDLASAKERFQLESHAATIAAANIAQNQFDDIYQNIRTIGRLPSVRAIDREGTKLNQDSTSTIQEIYNNLVTNVAVSEVYIVPRTLNADLIDPVTSGPEKPIISFDRLIANDSAIANVTKRFEAEIYEYHLLRHQMAWFEAHTPTMAAANGIHLPMISGGQVITCDNTIYNSTTSDSDRTGTIFSVPFFGPDGRFKGTISAIIRLKAVRAILPDRGFALVSPNYDAFLLSPHAVLDAQARSYARRAEPDPRLIYSEVVPLSTHDPRAQWSLWAEVPNAAFYKRPDVRAARTFELGAYCVMLLLTLIGVLIIWLIDRNARLVGRATTALTRLAEGDETYVLSGAELRGPAGGLARAFATFREALAEKRKNEARAEADRRLADAERTRHEQERAGVLSEQKQVVESLVAALIAFANGNLTWKIKESFGGSYRTLPDDFNQASGRMEQTMRHVAESTHVVAAGVAEITHTAGDLARRTEQQAVQLEEASAALNEITSSIEQTSRNARDATALIATARSDAVNSGEVVRATVEAMTGIAASARKITNIIGLIDEIAFQTNLLALNAGVEAARAGDAGRGFAVVATEVRALAQRSAQAAKEIESMISESSQQVESGVRLVDQTGQSLGRITGQINDLTGLLRDMAAAMADQATGLGHVNNAVHQIDKNTQHNAAAAEETTASSAKLAGEAASLAQLVEGFQIGSSPLAHSTLPRPEGGDPKGNGVRSAVRGGRRLPERIVSSV
jgi:methyl-accepting chemotaxis protein